MITNFTKFRMNYEAYARTTIDETVKDLSPYLRKSFFRWSVEHLLLKAAYRRQYGQKEKPESSVKTIVENSVQQLAAAYNDYRKVFGRQAVH